MTLAENDDARIGGPVTLHIIKLDRRQRFRGAIKTILASNIFEEKITLQHTGDFGGNTDDLVYQWYYREENGNSTVPLPPSSSWQYFGDPKPIGIPNGLGLYQINVEGTGGLILGDNLFFVRYRHRNDTVATESDWSGSEWKKYGYLAAQLDANGAPLRDANGLIIRQTTANVNGQWAGAANSPTVDGLFRPQLVQGWIKRVLDRINPYEARIDDFRNNGAPATYVSMIQQLGSRHEGAVALNPNKDVIENVGLIELYQTILDRGVNLSIGLSQPVTTSAINNALQLASTRISDFYMLLGNEAYSDAQDSTVGFGSSSAEYGSAASSIWTFMNQTASPLDERLALLRGVSDSYARPVYNRLFWNFTKDAGEAAYALTYDVTDENGDGFIDEKDAMKRYPQGHGDAWGHYTTALRTQYKLLQHPYFRWQPRSEFYNLLDVVIPVDYLDERKFATAAAARAKAGAEIVNLTYRSRYVENPDGQWQGYTDSDASRGWGVQDWARRAGQGAYIDWLTGNAILPAVDDAHSAAAEIIPGDSAIREVDRSTVTALSAICTEYGRIETVMADANGGLNPLGLAGDAVAFDIDPIAYSGGEGAPRVGHFQQIQDRAVKAAINARALFDIATAHQNNLRRQQDAADTLSGDVLAQDRDYRNRLIAIFGTPCDGLIGPGQPYPAGYNGPDLYFPMYVEVKDINNTTVPHAPADRDRYRTIAEGFKQQLLIKDSEFNEIIQRYFLNDLNPDDERALPSADKGSLVLNMPVRANEYAFQTPAEWGRRASTGELQTMISDLVQAEADLHLAVGAYDGAIDAVADAAQLISIRHHTTVDLVENLQNGKKRLFAIAEAIVAAKNAARTLNALADFADETADAVIEKGTPDLVIGGLAVGTNALKVPKGLALLASKINSGITRKFAVGFEVAAEFAEPALEVENFDVAIDEARVSSKADLAESLMELKSLLGEEATARLGAFSALEAMRQASDAYRSKLNEGIALIEERQDFNRSTAGAVQQLRYQDMAFRVFRNDALAAYRGAFDLAARYAWMAAKAYDYETNFDPGDPGSPQGVLESIMKAETLGSFVDGEPVIGTGGLADALARLSHNFSVLNGQLGLNNAQSDGSKISLRYELFRIPQDVASDTVWRQKLATFKVGDLWQVPEFRRYCRPFAPESAGAQPGLVIPFGTQIVAGRNVFGWPLGGSDNSFDPSLFATKVRAAGVWFGNYDPSRLALAPRVYLVPAGVDRMTVPTSADLKVRSWNIMDQRIPVPYPISGTAVDLPNFIPLQDSLDGQIGEIRRYSSFRAFGDTSSTAVDDQMTFDSRLVGRSVWNTRWMLIIPAANLSASGGVDKLIDGDAGWTGIKDITVYFKTFGFSGN